MWTSFRGRWGPTKSLGNSVWVVELDSLGALDYMHHTLSGRIDNTLQKIYELKRNRGYTISEAIRRLGVYGLEFDPYSIDGWWFSDECPHIKSGKVVLIREEEANDRPIKWAYYSTNFSSYVRRFIPFEHLFLETPHVTLIPKMLTRMFLSDVISIGWDDLRTTLEGKAGSLKVLLQEKLGSTKMPPTKPALILTIKEQEGDQLPERMIFR